VFKTENDFSSKAPTSSSSTSSSTSSQTQNIPKNYTPSVLDPLVFFDKASHIYLLEGGNGVSLASSTLIARLLTPVASTPHTRIQAHHMHMGTLRHSAWATFIDQLSGNSNAKLTREETNALSKDDSFLNVCKHLRTVGFSTKRISIANDEPMVAKLGEYTVGVATDNLSRDPVTHLHHILEFKSGQKPAGVLAVAVRPFIMHIRERTT
jgi:hypothetical protein